LKVLVDQKNGLERFDVLYELGFQYFEHGDVGAALNYFVDAQAVATAFGDSIRMVRSTRVKFQMLRRLDRGHEGLEELNYILPMLDGTVTGMSRSLF
jgi:hypothetical protein